MLKAVLSIQKSSGSVSHCYSYNCFVVFWVCYLLHFSSGRLRLRNVWGLSQGHTSWSSLPGTCPTRKACPLCISYSGSASSPVLLTYTSSTTRERDGWREGGRRGNSNSTRDAPTPALSTLASPVSEETPSSWPPSSFFALVSLSKRQHLITLDGLPVFKDTHFSNSLAPKCKPTTVLPSGAQLLATDV